MAAAPEWSPDAVERHYAAWRDSDLSQFPVYKRLQRYVEQKDPTILSGCTLEYVAAYLDAPQKIPFERPAVLYDWVTDRATLAALRKRGISGVEYAARLVEHKSITRAVASCLAPPLPTTKSAAVEAKAPSAPSDS